MKFHIAFYILLLSILASCKKEGIYTQTALEKTNIQNSVLVKTGEFTATTGITVHGKAEIRKHNLLNYVRLVDFSVSSGPDLKVYLSKKEYPSEFVNLGAFEPSKTDYKIPEGTTLEDYTHVLIHCQQFNHLFSFTKLN